ncbi:MAG: phenylalanine--tRNA ligase subunit beta [Gemmatimonadaceae bacterium]
MNASYEWLREFLAVDLTPAQLRDLLTNHSATVEELVALRGDLAPIVIGRVLEAGRHPDSDHLWLTKVDAGAEPLEVVCGAPNVTVGALYPFAPLGTTLPNGITIERRKIRGIYSNGMLCSARELGLGDDHQGILELNIDARPGTPLLSVMPIGDTRLVVDVGANRPDLLSHLGLAREIAAVTGTKWHLPDVTGLAAETPAATSSEKSAATAGISVEVASDTRARRYMAAVIRGVKVGASPEWLARRLDSVGVRSISNVVDATNYVLHEMGQPVHAFDLRKLAGNKVIVRRASPGEKLTTLDGLARSLPRDCVVIADAKRAQAVAGVMGGAESEVTEETQDILIEVASFDPRLTRSARRALGLSTDASYRFERGVDPELAPEAMDRVLRLILTLAGGTLAAPPADVVAEASERPAVTLRMSRVAQVLGEAVPPDRARGYLAAAGFEILDSNAQQLAVRVPSWRSDVVEEIDLVEEVARFHGYGQFPDEIRPFRPSTTFDDPLWTVSDRVRETLVGLGLLEARPMPFVHATGETHVRVANPLSENEAYLRRSMLETLTRRVEFNLAQRIGDVRLFEIGSSFRPGESDMPREQLRLGIALMGKRRPVHFTESEPPVIDEWDAKGVAESAARAAFPGEPITMHSRGEESLLWEIRSGDHTVGEVRRLELDAPVWASAAFGIELVLGNISTVPEAGRGKHAYKEEARPPRARVARFIAIPTMPPAEFDLALLVPENATAADVERIIRDSSGDLLERLALFDQYTGQGVAPGFRSLAWRLTFRHPERTLRDKEIEGRRGRILSALEKELDVRQRST